MNSNKQANYTIELVGPSDISWIVNTFITDARSLKTELWLYWCEVHSINRDDITHEMVAWFHNFIAHHWRSNQTNGFDSEEHRNMYYRNFKNDIQAYIDRKRAPKNKIRKLFLELNTEPYRSVWVTKEQIETLFFPLSISLDSTTDTIDPHLLRDKLSEFTAWFTHIYPNVNKNTIQYSNLFEHELKNKLNNFFNKEMMQDYAYINHAVHTLLLDETLSETNKLKWIEYTIFEFCHNTPSFVKQMSENLWWDENRMKNTEIKIHFVTTILSLLISKYLTQNKQIKTFDITTIIKPFSTLTKNEKETISQIINNKVEHYANNTITQDKLINSNKVAIKNTLQDDSKDNWH
jgi:hypothetical protein